MLYSVLAELVLIVHAAFIVFALLGGLLALRWRTLPWLQLPCVLWVILIELNGWICPLTPLENHFREAAGARGYGGDFIEHYLLPLVYPSGLTPGLQALFAAIVFGVNLAVYALLWRQHRRPEARETMGTLDRLFGRREQATPLDEARKILERFTTATLAGVDPEDIGRYPAKQRQVMAFHFGAIQHLAGEYELDETQTLAVFVLFLNRYFKLPVSETGSVSQLLGGFQSNPQEREFLAAGGEVFGRWHLQNDRRAPLKLGEMLNRT